MKITQAQSFIETTSYDMVRKAIVETTEKMAFDGFLFMNATHTTVLYPNAGEKHYVTLYFRKEVAE